MKKNLVRWLYWLRQLSIFNSWSSSICMFWLSVLALAIVLWLLYQLVFLCKKSDTHPGDILPDWVGAFVTNTTHFQEVGNLHSEVRPSCLQATLASLQSQDIPHTVPHCPWKHTSTRPSKLSFPPTNRISVLLQVPSTNRDKCNFWLDFPTIL